MSLLDFGGTGFAPSFAVSVSGASLAADVESSITDLSVTSAPQTLDQCSFTLVNAYPEMRWTHSSDADLFDVGASVEVELGYANEMQTAFDGEITTVTPEFPESGPPTLRLTARNRLHWLTLGRHTRTFQDATEADIVGRIANEAKLTPQVDQTTERHPYVMQYNATDLEFLLERARRINFELLVDGRTLVFRHAQPNAAGPPVELEWGRTLKSFRPSLEPTRQATAAIVRGYDPATKEPIVGEAAPAGGGGGSGGDLLSAEFGLESPSVEVSPPPANQEEADARAAALLEESAQGTVDGEGTCVGNPDLRAGGTVELTGLGPRFSGSYYVREATHTIGGGGYETRFSVARSEVG